MPSDGLYAHAARRDGRQVLLLTDETAVHDALQRGRFVVCADPVDREVWR